MALSIEERILRLEIKAELVPVPDYMITDQEKFEEHVRLFGRDKAKRIYAINYYFPEKERA